MEKKKEKGGGEEERSLRLLYWTWPGLACFRSFQKVAPAVKKKMRKKAEKNKKQKNIKIKSHNLSRNSK